MRADQCQRMVESGAASEARKKWRLILKLSAFDGAVVPFRYLWYD
jgi:hypothetical protein